ncbi:MAG TPA: HU family DNA-binding protein [Candidatus Thermoplasmatota archaeon]|nr:HU family DNA-binding protein [Candidatus Thermoplasmatota archaeon]
MAAKPAKSAKSKTSARTTDIAEHVAEQTGLSPREARAAVNATFEGVAKLLKKNDRVVLSGVGAFSKTVRPADKGGKKATNPFTGEPYTTKPRPASTKVRFRAGKGFNAHLSGR